MRTAIERFELPLTATLFLLLEKKENGPRVAEVAGGYLGFFSLAPEKVQPGGAFDRPSAVLNTNPTPKGGPGADLMILIQLRFPPL